MLVLYCATTRMMKKTLFIKYPLAEQRGFASRKLSQGAALESYYGYIAYKDSTFVRAQTKLVGKEFLAQKRYCFKCVRMLSKKPKKIMRKLNL